MIGTLFTRKKVKLKFEDKEFVIILGQLFVLNESKIPFNVRSFIAFKNPGYEWLEKNYYKLYIKSCIKYCK